MKQKLFWVVEAQVDPEIEQEWNDWYNEIHVPEVMTCPGFMTSQRMVHHGDDGRRYIAIYELSDVSATSSARLQEVRGWGPFSDQVTFTSRLYEAC